MLPAALTQYERLLEGGAYWNRNAYWRNDTSGGALIRQGTLIGRRALNRIIAVRFLLICTQHSFDSTQFLTLPGDSFQSSTFSSSSWHQGHECKQEHDREIYQQSGRQVIIIASNNINNEKCHQRSSADNLHKKWKNLKIKYELKVK